MELLQVVVDWMGGTGIVVVSAFDGQEMVLRSAGIEVVTPQPPPYPVRLEITGRLVPPGVQADSAIITVNSPMRHHVEFIGADASYRFGTEAGKHQYRVALTPAGALVPIMVIAGIVLGLVALSRRGGKRGRG